MFKILIDTCVWLDLAKDVKQEALLTVIEDLCQLGQLRLLVPDLVIAEFSRNKDKVVVDSGRSLASALKRAREAVALFGEDGQMNIALDQLHEVAQRLPQLGEAAANSVARIEKLLICGEQIPTSSSIKIRAAQRAIDRKAPFHRNKNSINDAILVEMYKDVLQTREKEQVRYAFVTHNTHDFSSPDGFHQLPHPDLAENFSQVKSLYFMALPGSG
jgi:predicted nucleic acid-binding protein